MKRLLRFFQIRRLHIFSDGNTDMVAFDPDDARRAWVEWARGEWDETYEPFDQQVRDAAIVSICCEPEDFEWFKRDRPPFSKIGIDNIDRPCVSAPAWLWCLWNGRGFLSSKEW